MNLADYLLEMDGLDWVELLSNWDDLLPTELTVWFANRFGEPFLVFEDGSVHRLDVDGGVIERLAESRDAFAARIDEGDNADEWLRISDVDAAVSAGLTLSPGRCYTYLPPFVLDDGDPKRRPCVLPLIEAHGVLADIHRQLRDVPDGAPIVLREGPRPE